MTRVAPTPAQSVIQSDEAAGVEAQRYLDLRARIDQIDAAERAKIAKIKESYAAKRDPLLAAQDNCFQRVQAWSEATRGNRKTIKFPNGREARWRFPSNRALLVLGKLPTIARLLLRRENWEKYLELGLKKNNIKSDLQELQKVPGLRRGLKIDDTEYFSIG